MFTKGDKILIAVVLFFSVFTLIIFYTYGMDNNPTYAVIEVNGKFFQKISLGSNGPQLKVEVPGIMGVSVVEIDKNRVRMLESPCKDQLCVQQGWIEKGGEMIVCLPNRVVVKVLKEKKDDMDGVSF
ncbi:NusG domain II-containing protein [Thermovenabulum gondwanense]|uniref:Uncharacterized protein n=1 Tax=Thermovenabulum gondwanense TaxID=520767 RepID=A0A161PVR8_9FIRM|nr:NusG domain II-containing protein [Thermovenabulum gondwanense]KYO64782.1 hypothetical protein ATZ99_18400 [Thermovenabulum gondwanense]